MAMAVNDLLQFSISGTFLGQRWMNVFHYIAVEVDESRDLNNMMGLWNLAYQNAMRPIMSDQVSIQYVDGKNLTNGVDIATATPSGVTGIVTGDTLPAFVAWSFRLNRSNATTRHGHKRIPGVCETTQTNGVAVAGMAEEIEAARVFVGSAFDFDPGIIAPVIIRRHTQEEPNPGTLDLSVFNPVLSAAYLGISTQNTRKPGRGI